MTALSPDAQKTLEALRKAVTNVLERKRRLGHYAVIWSDGKPVFIGEDAPTNTSQAVENNAATKPAPSNRA